MKKIYPVFLLALMLFCFFRVDVHANIIISDIRITDLNWPKEKEEPDTDFTVHCYARRFEQPSSAVTIDWENTFWYYYPWGPDKQPWDMQGSVFSLGLQYGVKIFLRAADGYEFQTSPPPDIYINDETEKLDVYFPLSDSKCLYIMKTFPPLAYDDPTIISSASILFDKETLPKEGEVVDQNNYPFFSDPRIVLIKSSTQPWSQYFDGIGWSTCPKDSKFEIGKQYRLHLECIPINKGMVCKFSRDFAPVIKGYPYEYIYAGEDHMAVNVYITCVEMNRVSMNLKEPKPGATTAYTTYSTPSDAHYTGSVRWITNDASKTPVTKFKDGNEYKAIIRFTAKEGYHFGRYYAISNIFEAELNGRKLEYLAQDPDNQWIEFTRVFSCGSVSKKAFNYLFISGVTEPEIGQAVPKNPGDLTVKTEHGIATEDGIYNPLKLYEAYYWYKNDAGVKWVYEDGDKFVNSSEGQYFTISYELNSTKDYTVLPDGFSGKINGRDATCDIRFLSAGKTYIILTINFSDPITEESKICEHTLKDVYTSATTSKEGYVEHVCSKCKECIRVSMTSKLASIRLGKNTFVYNGSKYVPQAIVKDIDGVTVSADNYKVSCPTNLTDVGEHKVTVTCKNKYSGSASFVCTILPKSTTLSKLKASRKKVKVTWKKQTKQMNGYQIRYSKKANFSKGTKMKTLAKPKATSLVLKKLTSKKYYYIQIRTYKKVGKKTFYSNWSRTKKIKVK